MKPDRIANIPIRHRFVDYVCTVGYSEKENSFSLLQIRYAYPRRNSHIKDEWKIYERVLTEPALRANLLESLVPDAKSEISELREKAILERGESIGFAVGLCAYALTGYSLYHLTIWLARHIGNDWAEIITYIPSFFAVIVVLPVQGIVRHKYLSRYCHTHSHLIQVIKANGREDVSMCNRCGLHFKSPSISSP